jgi:CheY-like chemotaxis protein
MTDGLCPRRTPVLARDLAAITPQSASALPPILSAKILLSHTVGTYRTEADTDMAAQQTVVIVVDENAGFLKGVARLLAHNGIESRTFASAEALIESGSAQTATCLLLDIHLGGISGIELQRRLAASGSKCPVIFMTANDDEATRNDAVDAGCIAYLRKPFARDVLMDAIGKAVA